MGIYRDRVDSIEDLSGDIRDEFMDILNEIESRINDAENDLKSIKSFSDLHLIEDCYDTLEELSKDIY